MARNPFDRWRAPVAAPMLPLDAPRAVPRLRLTAPTEGETKGQGTCHDYMTRVLAGDPSVYLRSVPTGIPISGKTEAERRALIRVTAAWTRAGMREGTPDYEIIRAGLAHLVEYKAEGATFSAVSEEQEANLLAALDAGCRVGVAHATQEETEELLLAWDFTLRFRLPPRAPHAGRGLRWPVEGERLRSVIGDARAARLARAVRKKTTP